MVTKQTSIRVLLLIALMLCHNVTFAELLASHRLISAKAVEGGTQFTFHLHFTNLTAHNYLDVTLSPADPALLPAPNESTISFDRLGSNKDATIPWKVNLPYAEEQFQSNLPVAFQGSATDTEGNVHSILLFSQPEGK